MNAKLNHTPGPWRYWQDAGSIGIYEMNRDGTCGSQIGLVLTENLDECDIEQGVADARLIAAAPELLEACRALWRVIKTGECGPDGFTVVYPHDDPAFDLLTAAIRKAEGGAS